MLLERLTERQASRYCQIIVLIDTWLFIQLLTSKFSQSAVEKRLCEVLTT